MAVLMRCVVLQRLSQLLESPLPGVLPGATDPVGHRLRHPHPLRAKMDKKQSQHAGIFLIEQWQQPSQELVPSRSNSCFICIEMRLSDARHVADLLSTVCILGADGGCRKP